MYPASPFDKLWLLFVQQGYKIYHIDADPIIYCRHLHALEDMWIELLVQELIINTLKKELPLQILQ